MAEDPVEDAKPGRAVADGAAQGATVGEEPALAGETPNALDPVPLAAPDPALVRLRAAESRLEDVAAAYRQLKGETDGYRERVTRNLERRYGQRHEDLLLKFIEILDNLDRALEAAQTTFTGGPMIDGLILVRSQLVQTLQNQGLERIPVLGMPYDPNVSEAVGTEPVEEAERHHLVVKELQRGYKIHNRIARASRVVLGEYKGSA